MTANATTSLKQALKALRAQRHQLTAELRKVDQGIAALEGIVEQPASGRPRSGGRKSAIKPVALAVLKEHGGPMHADRIVEALQQRGVALSARDPKASVVTALIRMAKETSEVRTLGQNRYVWVDPAHPERAGNGSAEGLPSNGEGS